MKGIAATEAKNRFGQLLEMAMKEPVAIEKKDRPVAVLISYAEYERLLQFEDRYWGDQALKALGSGMVAEPDAVTWIKEKL
ncbi:hypothetical protein GMSM_40560 [Geomonas sp. Red276]